MKYGVLITLLFFIVVEISLAQSTYSLENLETASQEELATYLQKATKLKKTGRTLNIIGGVSIGVLFMSAAVGSGQTFGIINDFHYGVIIASELVGIVSFATGIPMYFKGKKRIKRINSVMSSKLDDVGLKLSPNVNYNVITNSYYPGITVSLSF